MKIDLAYELQFARSQDGPAWRWREALRRTREGDYSVIRCPLLMKVFEFVRVCQQRGWVLQQLPPRLRAHRAAYELEQHPKRAENARLWTLSRRPSAEVASQLGVSEETLARWREMYFDVLANIESSVWIVEHVIRPEEVAGRFDVAARYRFAYFGRSAEVAQAGANLPPRESPGIQRLEMSLSLFSEQALNQAFSTPETAHRTIKAFTDLRRAEVLKESQAERREHQEVVERRKHELDMAQLALRKAKAEEETAKLYFRQGGTGNPASESPTFNADGFESQHQRRA